ncbi:hypothetical protein BGW38_001669 [Lunasporangiospora selenospora]|uniref:Uncharacterized protein n=1 Tax=Lunasporangiospora selenospora TaxID=979761 RepID=A0A9P6G1L9_9FUNG|nr:hypothetical protein BGW38_001669 [Lunasporangiospora selenospora]
MSLEGRTTPGAVIDQDQLDARLTRLIADHNHYRTLLFRYIRRSLSLCAWYIDQDCASFYRQFERTERLSDLAQHIRDHALHSFQIVEHTGTQLLSQVDTILARAPIPPAVPSISGGPNGGGFNNSRLLFLAGEVTEAIRFWREQCLIAQKLEPKVIEIERIAELRYLAHTGDGSSIDEKARAIRISNEQTKLVTESIEPFLDQWLAKLASLERPREEQQAQGFAPGHAVRADHGMMDGTGTGHALQGLPQHDPRSVSSHSIDSPAAGYLSQPWGQGAS